jgi:PAS domain S-box-containing protein
MTAHKDRKPHESSLEISKSQKPGPLLINENTAVNTAYLASFPELNPNPILELDLEGHLTYLNPAAKKIFADIEILGVKHPFLANWSQLVRELKDAKQSEIISHDISLGNLIYEQAITLSPQNKIRIYAQDITERKRAEESLIQSETYLRATLNSTGDGILVVDNHQTIITANGHFLEMFGIPRDLIVQKDDNPVLALVVAQMAEPEAFFNKVQELYNSNKIDRDTLHLKDGRIIERYSEPLILQEKIAGRVWSFRDNTELVLAEVGLKRSEEKYRLIVEKSTDIIFSFNGAGEFLYVSPSIKNLLGYDPNDLIGHPFQSLVHPDDFSSLQQAIQRNIKDGSQAPGGNRFRVRHASGDWCWHSATGNAVYNTNGKFVYFIAISRDITEHKKAEERLQATEQNFRNSLESSFMGIRIRDENDKTLYANPAFLNIFGYSDTDKIGPHPLIEHYTSEEKTRYLLRQGKRLRGEPVSDDLQVEIIGNGGAVRYLQVFLNEIFWNGKKEFQVVYNDITPLKNAETALKATEQNLYNSLDRLPIGVRITDIDENTLYLNQAFLKIIGYENIDEARAMAPLKYYTPASYADYLLRKEKFLRGEQRPDNVEVDIIRKDGGIRHLQLSTRELIWNGKQQFQTIYNDVTERKKAEDALKQSEQNFRNSMENSSIGIRISDRDGISLFANQALLDIFGYQNRDEIQTKPPQEYYSPECYASFLVRHEKFLRGEPMPKSLEIDIIRKDSTKRNLQVSMMDVFWDGKMQYQTLYNDVTELKHAEEALILSEVSYRRLFESAKDGILIINAVTGLITDVNPYLADLLGFAPKEFIGKALWEIGIFRDIVANIERFQELLEKRYVRYEDLPLKTDDGREISVEFVSNVYEVDHRRVIQCNIRNITERKQTEKEKKELEDKAQVASRLAAVGEMAAGVAHEINNPLTGVLGFSQMLLEKENVPEDIKADLKIIADGSQRVADIVKRLLTFARQTKPIRTLANINDLIDNTLKLRDYVLKTSNIEVITRLDKELPLSVVDSGQMQQVFLNLIVNAEQAMTKANGKGMLTITTEQNGNFIRISFRDDGPGITKEHIGRVFEPFFTTKDVGEGTGLGLSLSRSIVLEHGGRMHVESKFGHGANFIVEIPIVESPTLEIAPQQSGSEKTKITQKARILVVDDEPGVRELLERVLNKIGHSVDTITDANIAEKRLNAGAIYDVILLDIRMPGMSGTEFYGRIIDKNPGLKGKVIIITGDVMGTDIKDFLKKNNLPYLVKPFDINLVKEKINLIIGVS